MNWQSIGDRYVDYLRDESRLSGHCDTIFFPEHTQALQQALADCVRAGIPVTVQGGRTGIAAAGIPAGGRLICVEKMSGCQLQGTVLTVQCGTRLSEIQAAARQAGLVFPPNPTESGATIAGAVACAASGPNCLYYGDVPSHVLAMDALLPDGQRWTLKRGQYLFDDSGCPLPDGRHLALSAPLPKRGEPRWGFAPYQGMDLLDLFCGSEGTLAVLDCLRLQLTTAPAQTWCLLFFFSDWRQSLRFSQEVCRLHCQEVRITTVEFLDQATLALIRELRASSSALGALPDLPEAPGATVLVELESDDPAPPQDALLACLSAFASHGGVESDTWAASTPPEIARLHLLRHAAAEAVNTRLDLCRLELPELSKLCGAFQIPVSELIPAVQTYQDDIKRTGISGAIFGHASIGRLHVNLLPETVQQLQTGQSLLERWARYSAELGGRALSENGIGKLHRAQLAQSAPAGQLSAMAEIKAFFDPRHLLGPDTLLP